MKATAFWEETASNNQNNPREAPVAREGIERRLAAILAADVVGYSRLMGEDESWNVHQ